MIESVLAALKTGRNIYCDEKNINPLKIHYGDIVILLATRELFRKQKKIDLSFTEFEILVTVQGLAGHEKTDGVD